MPNMQEMIDWTIGNIRLKDVLCLAHLVGKKVLSISATIKDADNHFENECNYDCTECLYYDDCTVCVVEE